MPVGAMGDYSAEHWKDVKAIIQDSISEEFYCELVSVAKETKIIHSTIVQNVYENELVVCDISGKNPNVMFELGMMRQLRNPNSISGALRPRMKKPRYGLIPDPVIHWRQPLRQLRLAI